MCASTAYTSITHDGTLYTSHSSMHGASVMREAEMRVVIVAYTHYTRQRI